MQCDYGKFIFVVSATHCRRVSKGNLPSLPTMAADYAALIRGIMAQTPVSGTACGKP
jgi:hypothetical protein